MIELRKTITISMYLWSIFDFVTDIYVVVDFYQRCHYEWSKISFVISFLPNILFMIWMLHYILSKKLGKHSVITYIMICFAMSAIINSF